MLIHENQPVIRIGENIVDATVAVILLHGRGGSAQSMVPLANTINPGGVFFLIPQAANNTWYPNTAFGPTEMNEPDLSSALSKVGLLVDEVKQKGISENRILFGGFSQGACLASEYVVRNPGKYGGLFVLSGALIGPRGQPRNDPGYFDHMPVFIGASDVDPWVSYDLVSQTAHVFERMGANLDFRTYPGMDHTVNQDEIEAVKTLIRNVRIAV